MTFRTALLMALALGPLAAGQKAKVKAKPAAPAAPSPDAPAILGPGRYYKRDVPSLEGDWWALSHNGQGWELRRATLDVEAIPMEGDRKGQASGLDIGVKGDEATLLFRNVPGVAAFRKVAQAEDELTAGDAADAQRVTGRFRGGAFTVWSEPVSVGKGARASRSFVVKAEVGGQEQVLFLNPACEGCAWELMWAGDLDGDGKLDLLVGTTDEDDYGTLRLFLSGIGEPGRPLRQVAAQRWVFGD